VTHACGGGTERHVRELASALGQQYVRPVIVRPSRAGHLLWEEPDERGTGAWCRESTIERQAIERQLEFLRPVHAHIHHLLGLPELLVEILSAMGVSFDWTIHDYFTICPRINLIGLSGGYCGEPNPASCDRCLAKLGDDQGRRVDESIASWRGRFGRHLANARRIFVPSEDAWRRLAGHFSELPLLLRPHPEVLPELEDGLAEPILTGETVRVAVIGTIVPVKGAAVLEVAARDACRRRLPLEFHVIGSTDRDRIFARLGNVQITGAYREQEVYELLKQARCHLAFLPSPWPETFMYTLSIAMAARMFVVCLDHGAQAERLRAWGWGRILPPDVSPELINEALLSAARFLQSGPQPPSPPSGARYPDILTSYYGFTGLEVARIRDWWSHRDHPSADNPQRAQRIDHAHIH
jgi:glycosyltransferase involved in cell wall biosynthesis